MSTPSLQGDNADYYLFTQIVHFGFATTAGSEAGAATAFDLLAGYRKRLNPKPADVQLANDKALEEHPLWSVDHGGIVLYEGLRADGRTRTFFRGDQIEHLVAQARGLGDVILDPRVELYRVGNGADKTIQNTPVHRVYSTVAELALLRKFNAVKERPGAGITSPATTTPPPAVSPVLAQVATLDEVFDHARRVFSDALACYKSQRGTWIALDIEVAMRDINRITEIGFAVFPPAADSAAIRHFIVDENQPWRDRPRGQPHFTPFAFGISEVISLSEALQSIAGLLADAASLGPVFISCHDDRMERKYLLDTYHILPRESDFTISIEAQLPLPPGFVAYFDTQVLFSGMTGTRSTQNNRVSMLDMMKTLDIQVNVAHWHNAGNDAKWTLSALHAMLGRP